MTTAYTYTQWGVRYDNDRRYEPGYVETGGIRPGGDIGEFDEETCRYIASRGADRSVVKRSVTRTITRSEWEEA